MNNHLTVGLTWGIAARTVSSGGAKMNNHLNVGLTWGIAARPVSSGGTNE